MHADAGAVVAHAVDWRADAARKRPGDVEVACLEEGCAKVEAESGGSTRFALGLSAVTVPYRADIIEGIRL